MVFSFKDKLKKRNIEEVAIKPSSLSSSKVKSKIDSSSKKKSFGFGTKARHSLIVGDDGAILVYAEGSAVRSRNFIASSSPENLKEFSSILAKNPDAPLTLIIDSMDQSFIQQSLPPISSLGIKKLINRRLERDLGKDAIKGYVLLEREKTGRRDWNFLMVSLEKSPQLSVWLDFVINADNRLTGIYLLSVESEYIIKNLDKAMGVNKPPRVKKGEKKPQPSKWKFFISNNKVGGFRQVILKDGRIIFTRLGQSVGDATPEVIAGNIEQEMSSTIEYMKRMSFNPQDGLDIYVVASAGINAVLDISKIPHKNYYKFTPFEVAELLKTEGAAKPEDQFGDVILSVLISSSSKHRLTLSIPQATKVNNLYNVMVYERAFAGLAVLGMIGYGGMQGLAAWQQYSQIEDLNQRKNLQQKNLDNLNDTIKQRNVDVTRVNETIALYNQITGENTSPIEILKKLRSIIISPVAIRDVSWALISPTAPGGQPAGQDKVESVIVVLRFPEISSTDEAFSSVARKILKDLRTALPEYKITYTKLPDELNKKKEGGKVGIDLKDEPVEIAATKLEATLSLTKQPTAPNPSAPAPSTPNLTSTDELIGLGR